jgi:hypothetical protein
MTIYNSSVLVVIEWHKLVVGSSFYIPTLTPNVLSDEVDKAAQQRGMKVKFRFCVEGATHGVRFWRVK